MTFIPSSASMALLGRSEVLSTNENQSTSHSNNSGTIIGLVVFLVFMTARFRRRRSVIDFSCWRSNSHDNFEASDSEDNTYSFPDQASHRMHRLTPPPSIYHPDRRVNAADTDSAGRRTGGPDDPDWDGKDILPAYNKFDHPPKYDLGGVLPTQGSSAGNHPHNDTVMASTEAIPVVEDQSVASVRTDPSDGDDSALSAPRHEAPN
ncbi:hypothetical protein F4604DRAFT_1955488 [Suillus subluteus]|nr:hypothetical protein F4604DRAFT_1955488 [Suillus subluteus]